MVRNFLIGGIVVVRFFQWKKLSRYMKRNKDIMKQIQMNEVVRFSLITTSDQKKRILLTLVNNHSYYANGDIDIIRDVYYCHYGFTCWSNC